MSVPTEKPLQLLDINTFDKAHESSFFYCLTHEKSSSAIVLGSLVFRGFF